MPVSSDFDEPFAWILGFEAGRILTPHRQSQAEQHEQQGQSEKRPNVAHGAQHEDDLVG
jgi:hypothetical protein